MRVVMIGADRTVKGGVSAVVNNFYKAGLDQKVELTYIGTMVDGSKARKALQAAWALVRFTIAMPKADLVHVNMAADASCWRKLLFLRIAHAFHKKCVIHEHGGDFQGFYYERCSEKARQKIRRELNRADLFLVLSEEWQKFFSEIVDPKRIRVLQNGVPVPEETAPDYSSHKAVFLGRLCREKGVGELLAAAPAVKEAVPDFELILGGFWENGNEELEQRAGELADFVHCPGWVGAQEREQLFRECSVFVLPTWFEGQPVSLLEAMAAGLCVAASAVGGIPQILGEEPCGLLLEPQNEEALAESLIRLLRDEALRQRLGTAARERICREYDVKESVRRLLGFYEQVMEE